MEGKKEIATRSDGWKFLDKLFLELAKNLSLESMRHFLASLTQSLISVLHIDIGGCLMRHKDAEGNMILGLVYLFDENNRLKQEGIQIKEGDVFISEQDTPEYLQNAWSIQENTAISPKLGIGADYWLPLIDSDENVTAIIFLDDSEEALKLEIHRELTVASMFFCRMYAQFPIYLINKGDR